MHGFTAVKRGAAPVAPVEIEFGDGDETAAVNKAAPIIYNAIAAGEPGGALLEYDFGEGGALLSCRVESYSRGAALFADFLRDAKKYYKKTCLSAQFVYFFSYRPMYRELSHEQLCWYLFWRSRARGGDYIKTGLSYVFLYLFEQINLADLIGPEKVCANIINIWKNYRKEFPRIDKYAAEWLTDFILVNRLKLDFGAISEFLPEVMHLATLPELFMQGDFFADPANINLILEHMPVYDYKKSKFYSDKPDKSDKSGKSDKNGEGKNKDLFDEHVVKILRAVLSSGAFAKILEGEIADGVKVKATRESFMGAVCVYDHKKKITVEYKNLWKNFHIREIITNTVRHAENAVRDYLQIKSKLNVSGKNFPAELADIIREYRSRYLSAAKPAKVSAKGKKKPQDDTDNEPVIAEFAPDLQAAAEIERDSWETTNTLLELQGQAPADSVAPAPAAPSVTSFADDIDDGFEAIDTDDIFDVLESLENAEQADLAPVAEDLGDFGDSPDLSGLSDSLDLSDMAKLFAAFSDDELAAVQTLAGGRDFGEAGAEFMRVRGVMLEAVLEGANEKAMDFTGDVIFENGRVIEDYLEEIREQIEAIGKNI